MNYISKKHIAVPNYLTNNDYNYRNNIINFSIIMNNKKMIKSYINNNNDKDFQFRNLDRFSNKISNILQKSI